jgi:hypothetical protein
MNREAHISKARRIERTLAKLRPEDYEISIEGAMLAANHYANLALHVFGIRAEEEDIIHSEYLAVIDHIRFQLLAPDLLEALEEIEELRAPYVRGGAPGGEEAAEQARGLLARTRTAALALEPPEIPILAYAPKAGS